MANKFPKSLKRGIGQAEEYLRGLAVGGTLFEELGFFYLGPIDGHNLDHLIPVLKNIKTNKINKPIFLHVVTRKGYGYKPAEE